jgi:hypothetical protein
MGFKTALKIIIASTLFLQALAAFYNYSTCASNAYLSSSNLKCITCPANQIANTYQSVSIACQCAVGFAPSGNGGCSAMAGSCGVSTNTYYPLYALNGNTNTVSSCGTCASTAFTNRYAMNNSAMELAASRVVEERSMVLKDALVIPHFLLLFAVISVAFLPPSHLRQRQAPTLRSSNMYFSINAAHTRMCDLL